MFIVQAPYPAAVDTMVLRSPELSNQRNKAHSITRIRTGNGDLYTYINRKRGREVHLWNFLVSYEKTLEVKAFIRKYGSSLVKIIDHIDRQYIGYISINPFEFQGQGRAGGWAGNEAYEFALQLEEKV